MIGLINQMEEVTGKTLPYGAARRIGMVEVKQLMGPEGLLVDWVN